MNLTKNFIFWVSASSAFVAVLGNGEDSNAAPFVCPEDPSLECDSEHSKKTCSQGPADFEDFKLPENDILPMHEIKESAGGYHCDCKENWTGLKCRRKFQTCDIDGNGDNGDKCYHGGECIDGVLDQYGNEQLFCDCRRAGDRDGNKYVGKFCEIKATLCGDQPGEVGGNFCLNDGTCTNKENAPCSCGSNSFGPHCEFKSKVMADAGRCTLKCKNDGVCVRGFEDLIQARYQFDQDGFYSEWDYQFCRCPDGFDGLECENNKGESEKYGPTTAGKVGIALSVIALVGVFIAFARFARKQSALAGKEIDTAEVDGGSPTNGSSNPVLDMGPERDSEGNELNNVEII